MTLVNRDRVTVDSQLLTDAALMPSDVTTDNDNLVA